MKRRITELISMLLVCSMVLSGCGSPSGAAKGEGTAQDPAGQEETVVTAGEIPSATQDVFAMDTYMTITGYGEKSEEAVEAAVEEIKRLDAMLSVGNADSEIARINKNGTGTISEDTQTMLEEALSLYQSTDKAFDITIYPLMVEWGFTSENYHVPDEATLKKLLKEVDASRLQYDEKTRTLTLGKNQGIDFGGIAKGFTSDRIMEIFKEYDLVSGCISLGGNVQTYGLKTDGTPWRCGIQNPDSEDDANSFLGIVSVADQAVITSGGYERYFTDEKTGTVYHHILDPSTGYSARSGLTSVTIVSDNGMLADGLSTSIYIMGLEKATEYWKKYGDSFQMILMTEDDQVYITEGLTDCFTTEFPLSVIKKNG